MFFNPDVLSNKTTENPVQITRLEVNNRPVPINILVNGQTILKRDISYTDSLVLNNRNCDFSLTFTLFYPRRERIF